MRFCDFLSVHLKFQIQSRTNPKLIVDIDAKCNDVAVGTD